jgi:hypothetical protein
MPQHEPDHSSQFRAKVKNEQNYTSHSPIYHHGVWWQLSTGILLSCLRLIRHDLQMSGLSLSCTKHHGMLMHRGVEAHLHAFLILVHEQGKCSPSSPSYFLLGKRSLASIEYKARLAPDLVWMFWRTKRFLATTHSKTLIPQPLSLWSSWKYLWMGEAANDPGLLTLLILLTVDATEPPTLVASDNTLSPIAPPRIGRNSSSLSSAKVKIHSLECYRTYNGRSVILRSEDKMGNRNNI